MPAQIYITQQQAAAIAELEHPVIITEGPGAAAAQAIDVWVLDDESMSSNTHRSVVLDTEGNVLGDTRLDDSR